MTWWPGQLYKQGWHYSVSIYDMVARTVIQGMALQQTGETESLFTKHKWPPARVFKIIDIH